MHGRIDLLLKFLRLGNPHMHIILMGLLPRGGLTQQTFYSWPSDYTPALEYINFRQQEHAATDPDFVHFLDCGDVLLPSQKV